MEAKNAELTEEQRAAMKPVADSIQELRRALDQQMTTLVRMASMIDARVADPASGVRFNVDTLTFIYPPAEDEDVEAA